METKTRRVSQCEELDFVTASMQNPALEQQLPASSQPYGQWVAADAISVHRLGRNGAEA
jgi:hypothetical protein